MSTQKEFVIPLRKYFHKSAPKKRTPKAVRSVKEFLIRHCKAEEIKLGPKLNEKLWASGIKNPPAKVAVNVKIADGVAKAELKGFEYVDVVKVEKKSEETLKDKLSAKLGVSEEETESKDSKQKEESTAKDASKEDKDKK